MSSPSDKARSDVAKEALASGTWKQIVDPTSKMTYYVNPTSKQTTFDLDKELAKSVRSAA